MKELIFCKLSTIELSTNVDRDRRKPDIKQSFGSDFDDL